MTTNDISDALEYIAKIISMFSEFADKGDKNAQVIVKYCALVSLNLSFYLPEPHQSRLKEEFMKYFGDGEIQFEENSNSQKKTSPNKVTKKNKKYDN